MMDVLVKFLIARLKEYLTAERLEKVKLDAVCYLKALAKKSDNVIDDQLVEVIAGVLGVDASKCTAEMVAAAEAELAA